MATSFEVEPVAPAPRRSIFQSSNRMRSLHRASVTAGLAARDTTFAEALKAEADEFGEEAVSKISSFEAIANFVIGCIGAGIVVFPKVMAGNGMVQALGLIILGAFVCFETGRLILESCDLAELCASARKGSMANYEEIAGAAFGRPGTIVLAIVKNFYALGSLVGYAVLLTEGLASWLPWPFDQAVVRWCLVLPMLLLLSMITNLKQLARVAPLGTFAVFSQCAAICILSLMVWIGKGFLVKSGGLFNLDPFPVGSALAVFVFGFDGVVNLPSIRGQMSNPEELPSALRKGFGVVASFCMVVMSCGFLGYGTEVEDNVIEGMSKTCGGFQCIFAGVASLGVIVNLLISYPLIFFTVISFIESVSSGGLAEPLHKVNALLRASMALSLVLIGLLFKSPKEIIALVSAVFGSCLSIFFPLAMCYQLRKKAISMGHSVVEIPLPRKLLHILVLLTGAVACIFGFLDALNELAKEKTDDAKEVEMTY